MTSKPYIICIIDDDLIYQYTATRTIKANDLAKKILVFSDGDQAMQFLLANIGNAEEIPDVIFLDINMPVMNGWQFLEEYVNIRPRIGKRLTLYMVSSSVDPVDLEQAKKISAVSDYIIKPITPKELTEIINVLDK